MDSNIKMDKDYISVNGSSPYLYVSIVQLRDKSNDCTIKELLTV